MHVHKFYAFIFFLVAYYGMSAQRSIETTSGQKIIIFDDGTWEKEKNTISEDTSGMLVSAFNPLTAPKVEKFEIEEKHKLAIDILFDKARSEEIKFLIAIESINKQISGKELELTQAKLNKNKSTIKAINAEMDDYKSELKELISQYNKSTNQIIAIEKLKDYDHKSRTGKIKSLAEKLNVDITPYMSERSDATKPIKLLETEKNKQAIHCNLMKDEMRGKNRLIQTEPELLFDYTPAKLKTYFKTNNLLKTNTSIRKEGKHYFLHLHISISSKDAAKNYGFIGEGSLLKILLINGRSISTVSDIASSSRIENYTGNTIYEVYYSLTKDDVNNLMKFPLDYVGIMWSSGFEKYDIYQVDVLINQLNCLKSL